jgi:hypothetical protein
MPSVALSFVGGPLDGQTTVRHAGRYALYLSDNAGSMGKEVGDAEFLHRQTASFVAPLQPRRQRGYRLSHRSDSGAVYVHATVWRP